MFKTFIPFYPKPDVDTLNWSGESLEMMNRLAEFRIIAPASEEAALLPGVPLTHQRTVAALMSGATGIEALLLMHEMGTGKTCSASFAIDANLGDRLYGMRSGIVLSPSKPLSQSFGADVNRQCHHPDSVVHRPFFQYMTTGKFARLLTNMSNERIADEYNSTFLVVDEVHHVGRPGSVDYEQLERFLRVVRSKKVLLMTGTPMRDMPGDFAEVFNLLIDNPRDKLVPEQFEAEYLTAEGRATERLTQIIAGRVSYLAAAKPEIEVEYMGDVPPELANTKAVEHDMEEPQASAYIRAFYSGDKDVARNDSRQAERFVFPDGTYGAEGYKRWMRPDDMPRDALITAMLSMDFDGSGRPRAAANLEEKTLALNRFSRRYVYIARTVAEAARRGEKSIVYDDLVEGSGLYVFAIFLREFGMVQDTTVSGGSMKFAMLTSKNSARIDRYRAMFNAPDNWAGANLAVIVGSRVISTGLTFKDVSHEHVVPHWNDSITRQVVARGIRLGSHRCLFKHRPSAKVRVYLHVGWPHDRVSALESVGILMCRASEAKRAIMDEIRRVAATTAPTCHQFLSRNGGSCMVPLTAEAADTSNLVAMGVTRPELLKRLEEWLVTTEPFTLREAAAMFPEEDERNLYEHLMHIMRAGRQLGDTRHFLNVDQLTGYFYTTMGVDRYGDLFMAQYQRRVVPGALSEQRFYDLTLRKIADRTLSGMLRSQTVELRPDILEPGLIQRAIEAAVTTRLLGRARAPVTTDWDAVTNLMRAFRPFWHIWVDHPSLLAASWYSMSIAGVAETEARVLLVTDFQGANDPVFSWRACPRAFVAEVNRAREKVSSAAETAAKERGHEFLGQHNPRTNAFCIKDLRTGRVGRDKRTILSGKRCQHYTKKELKHIAASVGIPEIDITMWGDTPRNEICDRIGQKFVEANLVTPDTSCGVQAKRKFVA